MDPVSGLVFAAVVAWVVMRAAGQAGADQARVEMRRAREAVRESLRDRRSSAARRVMARLEAGRDTGPVYPMWWAWAAVRSGGALWVLWRAARQPRRSAEAGRSGATGPVGRIAGAARRGGAYAWSQMRQGQAAAGDGEAQAGPGGPWRAAGAAARPPRLGICEWCGAAVAVTALATARNQRGTWARMCVQCRHEAIAVARARPKFWDKPAADDAQSGAPADGDIVDAEIVEDEPGPGPAASPDQEQGSHRREPGPGPVCVRCGEPLGATACLNPGCPLCPGYRTALEPGEGQIPDGFRMPVRYCSSCRTQLLPGTWWAVRSTNADVCLPCAMGAAGYPSDHLARYPEGACRERTDGELYALGTPVGQDGREIAVGAVDPQVWHALGRRAAQAALAAAPVHEDSPPGSPAGARAPAPAALPATPSPTPGDDMSCNGEVHTQADWAAQATGIQAGLSLIGDSAENMLRSLDARHAGRDHMRLAAEWADQVHSCITFGTSVITEVNTRQDPYVGAVQAAGGSAEVADPAYYDEM